MTKLKPYLVCKECRHEEGWYDRELGCRWYFCGKYHKLVGNCKKDCLKLRKGLVRQILENCPENKGGFICVKEYENKCLAQKVQYIKELQQEIEELKEKSEITKDRRLTEAKDLLFELYVGFLLQWLIVAKKLYRKWLYFSKIARR